MSTTSDAPSGSSRAPRRRRRSRRSPTTRSSPNCHTGALVAPDGAIDWLCVPRFDSPSVFGSLLDREAGFFRFGPFGINHPTARVYEPGTNVLVTTWKTPTGWIVVRDALTMGPRGREDDGHAAHPAAGRRRRRPHARADRRVPRGRRRDRARLRAGRSTTAATPAEWTLVDGDRHAADATGAGADDPPRSDLALGIEGGRVRGRHVLAAGRAGLLRALVGRGPRRRPRDVDEADGADRRHDALLARAGSAGARIPDHRWRDPIQRSALAIKGLTYMPTGATVAALTTSLPETPGGERNWDYRYTWMRDTTFTLQALHWLNLDWEADEFMQFVADLEPERGRRRCRSCTASTGAAT